MRFMRHKVSVRRTAVSSTGVRLRVEGDAVAVASRGRKLWSYLALANDGLRRHEASAELLPLVARLAMLDSLN